MALDHSTAARSDFRRGLWLGLASGLLTGIPAGVALKVAGYPSGDLHTWWALVVTAYVVVLLGAAAIALRRGHLALGLATGATSTIALAPLLVVLDIVAHSE